MSVEYGSARPRLDTRLEGKAFVCTAGVSTHYYNFTHEEGIDSIIFNGVETFSNGNMGDSVSLWTEYFVPPLNVWKRYKKFGKNYMAFPNTLQKNILFPTKPKNGVRLVVQYNNIGQTDVTFLINLFNFVDQQKVDLSTAQEGVDW